MYVGAWQEYKMLQQRVNQQSNNNNNSNFNSKFTNNKIGNRITKNDLKAALLNTLNSNDVEKAMKAMEPLLQQADVQTAVLPSLSASSSNNNKNSNINSVGNGNGINLKNKKNVKSSAGLSNKSYNNNNTYNNNNNNNNGGNMVINKAMIIQDWNAPLSRETLQTVNRQFLKEQRFQYQQQSKLLSQQSIQQHQLNKNVQLHQMYHNKNNYDDLNANVNVGRRGNGLGPYVNETSDGYGRLRGEATYRYDGTHSNSNSNSVKSNSNFYNNDNNQVVVEMVSLNMLNLVQFWDHLEKFAPDEDNLHIPSKFKFTEQEMALIRKMYAIVTDNSSAHKWRTTTKVWGFKNDGLFNKGKKVLLGVLKPPEIPQQNQDQKLSRPSSPTALASPSVTSSSSITTADNTTSETASSALQLIEQTRTNFRFKTREAGIFYQTFESTTRAYIENISGISIDKLDKSRASKSSSNIMQTTVSLLGSKEQTKVAKDYLKNLQSSLTHMQTLFLKVSMQKYKQLHEVKLAFETCHIHPNCDPLLVSQIVSVRLKPPLNTRGLKKMEFPCDVWATVCGPNSSYVTEVQELLEKLSNPFDTRISYINKTGLLNSIIQDNSTRKEFVEYYNLCGVRANDSIKNGTEQIKLYVWSNNLDQRQDLQAILDQASKVSNNTCDDDGSEVVTSHSDLPSGPVSELESVPSAYNSDNNDDDDTSYDSAYSGLCYDSDSSNNNCEKSSAASKRSESQLPPYTSHEINTDNVEKDSMSQVARVLNDMTSQVILKETLAPCASLLRKTAEAGSNSRSHQYAEGGQYDEDIHSFLACVKLHQQNFGTTDIASLIKKQIYQSGVEESTDRSANLFLELDRSLTAMGGLHGLHPLNKDDEITE